MESATKCGEIKFVIKSIIPITSDFTTVIKNSNDSSTDNLLEFRSLLSNSLQVDAKSGKEIECDKSYSGDVQNFIQKILDREKALEEQRTPEESKEDSGCKSETIDSSGSMSDLVIAKKQKINDIDGSPAAFAIMASSTPIKLSQHRNINLDISGVGFLSFAEKVNKNGSLNDSDFESMDQDQYDESPKKDKNLDEDATLVVSQTSKNSENKSSDKENMSVISRTSSLSDFKNGFRMIFEETVRRTPMALRRAFNMDSDSGSTSSSLKKSKFLNIFSSTKKLKRKQSPGKKRHSRRSGSSKKKYPLTKENVQILTKENSQEGDNENVEWGDNFDYSFVCEPASSEIDENDNSTNYISYNASLDSSIEMLKSPLVPSFRIDPPADASLENHPPACDYVRHILNRSSFASVTTSLRRSMSAPAFDDATDDDSTAFAYSQANTTKTCEAAIKNLTQLSVSTTLLVRVFTPRVGLNEADFILFARFLSSLFGTLFVYSLRRHLSG